MFGVGIISAEIVDCGRIGLHAGGGGWGLRIWRAGWRGRIRVRSRGPGRIRVGGVNFLAAGDGESIEVALWIGGVMGIAFVFREVANCCIGCIDEGRRVGG
jgi:hypothetical protein